MKLELGITKEGKEKLAKGHKERENMPFFLEQNGRLFFYRNHYKSMT